MPSYQWSRDVVATAQHWDGTTSGLSGVPGALLMHACWAADGLHYLADLDAGTQGSGGYPSGHHPDLIDLTHARAMTATAVTALDLCAAAMGVAFCGESEDDRVSSIRDFDARPRGRNATPAPARVQRARTRLPRNFVAWVDTVVADSDYELVLAVRHSLTHARVRRALYGGTVRQRMGLHLATGTVPVETVMRTARDLATRHCEAFVALVAALP